MKRKRERERKRERVCRESLRSQGSCFGKVTSFPFNLRAAKVKRMHKMCFQTAINFSHLEQPKPCTEVISLFSSFHKFTHRT